LSFELFEVFIRKNIIMKNILLIVGVAASALIVGFFAAANFNPFKVETSTANQSTVLLEKIKIVSKLVTVEGYFSEVWQTTKTKNFGFFDSKSKAIIKVQGKVSVGYNLENMKIETFPDEKIVRITNVPTPEIISVDHELDYFSLDNGYFVSFSTKEMSAFDDVAKDTLIAAAKRTRLFETANEKGNDVLKLIELIVKDAGWEVQYENGPSMPNQLGASDTLRGAESNYSDTSLILKSNKKQQNHAEHITERYRPMAG
jgi:hypothetical protein